MKLLAVVLTATIVGLLIANRDDITRYLQMRQM